METVLATPDFGPFNSIDRILTTGLQNVIESKIQPARIDRPANAVPLNIA